MEIRKSKLGADDPDSLASMHNLAFGKVMVDAQVL
jgi:hypothetical protein